MDSSRGKKTIKCIENWTRRLIKKFSAVTIQGTSIAVKCNKADATDVAEGVDAFILIGTTIDSDCWNEAKGEFEFTDDEQTEDRHDDAWSSEHS